LGDDRFTAFPEIRDVLKNIPKDVLNSYLLLEYDFGSLELAESLFHFLKDKKRVALIRFSYHRGILDGNRDESRAVRRIFNHIHYPELMQKLWRISGKTYENILGFCQKSLQPKGYFIDVHSMWPTSQYIHPSDFEHETRLQKYVEALLHPQNQKEVRAINFLVHDLKNNPVADEVRARIVFTHLQQRGYSVQFDEPYRLLDRYNSTKYYAQISGLSFDVPRTFLGHPKLGASLPVWELDHQKIHSLANAFSEGVMLATHS
jgi:hypothetical protein